VSSFLLIFWGLQSVEDQGGILWSICPARSRRITCMSATWMELASSKTGRSSEAWPGGRPASLMTNSLLVPAFMKKAEAVAADGG